MTPVNPDPIQRLRLTPLNLIAAIKLRQAEVCCPLDAIPVFQLMEWGLADGKNSARNDMFGELLKLRYLPDPERALAYLTEHTPGGLPLLHRTLLRLPPQQAAETLLNVLDMRLKADPCNPYPERR